MVEGCEGQLADASWREGLLQGELRSCEAELAAHAGVYVALQRTVAQLDHAEATAVEQTRVSMAQVEATRAAESRSRRAKEDAEEARAQAATDRAARAEAEEHLATTSRQAERQVGQAEAAKQAALRAADELTASTSEGALALGEAVDALHRWVDGVLVHGRSNGAATLEAVAATTRGQRASPALRGAHAGLYSLQARMQHVCEEVLRLRREAGQHVEAAKATADHTSELHERLAQSRRRGEKLEAALLKAEERVQAAEEGAHQAEAKATVSAAAAKDAEVARAHLESLLQPRQQLAHSMAVQLSDALRRSGCVKFDAPMLVDASAAGWPWERLAVTTSALASHTVYYWDAQQAELIQVRAQLDAARERVKDKEASLARAVGIASGMRRTILHRPQFAHGPEGTPIKM